MKPHAALLLLTIPASLCFVAIPSAVAQPELLATWEGLEAAEQFGVALTIGGDANGDGRADLAVGASTNDENGESAGKVSIFLGRATPAATPDLELFGAPGSFFGSSVAWAGDINGDAFDDLLVGAFRDDEAGTNAGKAYLFLGGDPMDGTADLTITGPAAGAYFGQSVAGAGDLNGDQIADFAIGAPRTPAGTVYLFFGADPPDATADLVLDGFVEGDRFGESLAGVGNADSIAGDDLLVGAPRASTTHIWQGEIYLFSGGAALDAHADWTFRDEDAGAHLGTSVAAAGDLNGDGAPDLLAGAPYRNVGSLVDAGRAYLFYGGSQLDADADLLIEGSTEQENLGQSVAGCGDVTANGFGHVLIGAPGFDDVRMDIGRIVIVPGGDPPQPDEFMEFLGEDTNDQYGFAVAGGAPGTVASFCGSAWPDIVAGAWGYGSGGKCYLYGLPGGSGGLPNADDPSSLRQSALRLDVQPNPSKAFTFRLTGSRPAMALENRHPATQPTELRIMGPDGSLIRRISLQLEPGAGQCGELRWDGRGVAGTPMPTGVYFAVAWSPAGPAATQQLMLIR